jgi:SAM-dependent methyltransferase
MKKIRDLFSGHSGIYYKYRPRYPRALYKRILDFTEGRENLWDCATGNGQVAAALAGDFEHIYATDISANQLTKAPAFNNIKYLEQRAENTSFKDGHFDLITVAQAIHWFDIDAFLKEASRVCRDGGVLAVWGYGLLQIDMETDPHILHFYQDVTGPFWDGERIHIDQGYSSIEFVLEEQQDLGMYRIEVSMDLDTLLGYLTSWSSVQNYIRLKGENPVEIIGAALRDIWKTGESKNVVFPIFGTMGRMVK